MASTIKINRQRAYRVRWREAGKQKSRCFETQQEAAEFTTIIGIRAGAGQSVTFYAALQLWLSEVKSTCRIHTYQQYKYVSIRVCNHIGRQADLAAVTSTIIANYRDTIATTLQPKTVNHLRAIRAFFSFCIAKGWVMVNPVIGVKFPRYRSKIPDWLDDVGVSNLLVKVRTAPDDIRLAVLLAVRGGLRLGDLVALRWSDIQGDQIHINEGKSSKPRFVPIHPDVSDQLKLRKRKGPWVFPSRYNKGEHRQAHHFGRLCGHWIKENGFPGTGLHALRHTFAVQLAQAGATLVDLQEILGHCSIQTSRMYLHSSRSRQSDLIARLGRQQNQLTVLKIETAG
jgi:integrase